MTMKWMPLAVMLGAFMASPTPAASGYRTLVPVGAQNRVQISNPSGSVSIASWDRREVEIRGELEEGVDSVEVTQNGGHVDVRVVLKDRDQRSPEYWRESEARLEIKVPADAQIEVSTVSASIAVSGVRGRQRLRSVGGEIRSDILEADADATTVGGRIELTGTGKEARVRVSSVSGSVKLHRVAGAVEARSTSGDLDLEISDAGSLAAASVSGRITVRGSLTRDGSLELSSVSGPIVALAKAPAGYRYDIGTSSGAIGNCFDTAPVVRGGSGARLDGMRGEGSARVRIRNHSGAVEICDR